MELASLSKTIPPARGARLQRALSCVPVLLAGFFAVNGCFGFKHPTLHEPSPDASASAGAGGAAGGGGFGPNAGGSTGSAGESQDVLEITTSELPDAIFGQEYLFELQASGLRGAGESWALSAGELPSGIGLEADGTLHGTPCHAASFQFEVTLTDGGSSVKRSFGHEVRRDKPWLVYVSGPHADSEVSSLYALRITGSLPLATKVSPEAQPDASIQKYAFSPDGSWLALTTDATVDERMDLFLVDMRGESPESTPHVELPVSGSVEDFAWSPGSDLIAIAVGVASGESRLFWARVSNGPPFAVESLAGSPENAPLLGDAHGMGWASDTRLVYPASDVSYQTLRTANGFQSPEPLAFLGSVIRTWPERDSALFSMPPGECDASWYLADFVTDRWHEFDGLLEVSPRLDHVAYWNGRMYVIYPWDFGEPIAYVPTTIGIPCPPAAWSNDGRFFATTGLEDRLALMPVGAPASKAIAGAYSTATRPAFSGDSEWLAFASELEIWITSQAGDAAFGEAILLPSTLTADAGAAAGEGIFRFSPDSKMLAYGQSTVQQPSRVYVAHLDGSGETLEITDVSSDEELWTVVDQLDWASDSMTLAYVRSASLLYVVERCSGLPSPHVEPLGFGSSYTTIQSFAFQP